MSEIKIREIEENDLEKGFLETLDFLRKASDIDKNKTKPKSYNLCCHR
jgi:hypothetical protein